MTWVIVFVLIGLAGLVSVVMWAVWLFHKAADLFSEVAHLGRSVEQTATMLSSVRFPSSQD